MRQNNTADTLGTGGSVQRNNEKKRCNMPAALACIVMLLCIGSGYVLSGNYINSTNPYATFVIAQICVFLIPCAFFAVFSGIHGFSGYKFRLFSPKMTGFVLCCLPMLVFGNMLIKYMGYVYFGVSSGAVINASGREDFLYILISGVLVPAVCEELLFRGVIFAQYEKKLGAFGAILGSALLFSFIHFDIQNFVSYFYAGIILGIAVHTTQSVFAPVLLHLLNNFICIYSHTFLQRISKESISTVFVLFLFGVLMLISLFLFFESLELICSYKAEMLTSHSVPVQGEVARLLPPKGKITAICAGVILAPAFLLAFAIYIVRIITLS